MKTLEINQNIPVDFHKLPDYIQKSLDDQACVNCEKPLDKRDIMYVACYNGQTRWWHYYRTSARILKNEGCLDKKVIHT